MYFGETKENSKGSIMKIIKINNASDIYVEFQDKNHYVRKTTYSNFQKGNISNPFYPTVHGVGYKGVGKFVTNHNCAEYVTWKDMLGRCYSEKMKNEYQSYFGISEVCDEWLNYQEFGKWYEKNKYIVNERLHLDKDILFPGNKIYSPYHCLLVPQRINMLFTNRTNDKNLPNGIRKTDSGKYSSKYCGIELGVYNTLEEAYSAYANEKENKIKEIAEEYKNIIPTKVYNALCSYKVKIENDKNYMLTKIDK